MSSDVVCTLCVQIQVVLKYSFDQEEVIQRREEAEKSEQSFQTVTGMFPKSWFWSVALEKCRRKLLMFFFV